ncbi:MAG: HNH endonuclease [Rhodobacteraceae bacterium]|nr:HNH endonuclease [Paracoccaceae bacterium]
MVKAVFIQNPVSIYKDRPGEAYHFPKRYLGVVRQTIDDWVLLYESRSKGGAFGYVGVQKVVDVLPDPEMEGHYYATLDRSSEWSFEYVVPRAGPDGLAFEKSLRGADGRPASGGANVSAVRRLTEAEFAAIVNAGLAEIDGPDALPRSDHTEEVGFPGFAESQAPFGPEPLAEDRPDVLMMRKYRDASFARQVKAAYGGRCAFSGLMLRNGGGRPEVEAAHIRPVAHGGPDTVRNGLALSGTLHWMFDRGLIAVSEDLSLLVSHNKVPGEVADRLLSPDRRLHLPQTTRHRPHPEYLRYHREMIFGG